MGKIERTSAFEVFQEADGDYRWRLMDESGKQVRLDPGTAPGVRMRKGYPAIKRAVQAALKAHLDRQTKSV